MDRFEQPTASRPAQPCTACTWTIGADRRPSRDERELKPVPINQALRAGQVDLGRAASTGRVVEEVLEAGVSRGVTADGPQALLLVPRPCLGGGGRPRSLPRPGASACLSVTAVGQGASFGWPWHRGHRPTRPRRWDLGLFVGAPRAALARRGRDVGTHARLTETCRITQAAPCSPDRAAAGPADRTSGDQEGHRVVPSPGGRTVSVALHS
jgi:hypothetical protein